MTDPQEGTPSEILFLVGRPPLDRTATLHRRRLVRQLPKMEIIAVRERERKLKQKLRLTDYSVGTGVKRFRVTESSIDLILRSDTVIDVIRTHNRTKALLNQMSILSKR